MLGGGEHPFDSGQTKAEGLLHKAEEIGTPQRINYAQQSLMLRLSQRKLACHGSGVGRDQATLRHLQLTLLRLHICTSRLQSAKGAVECTALGRKLTKGTRQCTRVCRESCRRSTACEIRDQLVQGIGRGKYTKRDRAVSTKDKGSLDEAGLVDS